MSCLEQLPEIVALGRKQAEKILEGIESRQRITLQTREVVLPAKDSAVQDWITSQARTAQREVFAPGQASLIDSPQPMLGDATTTVRPELVEGLAGASTLRQAQDRQGSARTETLATKILTIKLKNYVLLSPEAINLDDANRVKLQAIANQEPLALIEYWAVDPDYDGKVFRSVWQDYRGNTARDADALRVVMQAVLTVPVKTSPRRVCVRAVDVFGFEAEVVVTVGTT